MRWRLSYAQLPPDTKALCERELTKRQLQVLTLWLAGCGHKRIATMLEISPSTAQSLRRRALEKIAPHIVRS